jgi:hypothetical protein
LEGLERLIELHPGTAAAVMLHDVTVVMLPANSTELQPPEVDDGILCWNFTIEKHVFQMIILLINLSCM